MIFLLIYTAVFVAAYVIVHWVQARRQHAADFNSRKTVTFGDESSVRSNRLASVISVLTIFLLWGAFTGSHLLPRFLHAPGPFEGNGAFTYTLQAPDGTTADGRVSLTVFPPDAPATVAETYSGSPPARNMAVAIQARRNALAPLEPGTTGRIVAIDGQPVQPGGSVATRFGAVSLSERGTMNIQPARGWQMEPIWLPSPEAVWRRLLEVARDGFRNFSLWQHLGASLGRVFAGFALGALVGIPLGYAMGLSDWFRGWFEPIVEFMRPVPPLALIPLVIIWAGIGEAGKIILLFLAALWIMAIAARSGVSGINVSKVHAAYSLGATRWQILRHVIIPNSLPEIFTGARVAMGVCWGTVVAAELVAAEKGAGMMIMVASKFQSTDIVLMGIILIGLIGFGIDLLMRWLERMLVPWKGRS